MVPLLSDVDPPPIELLTFNRPVSVALVCEHAGRAVPKCLQGLELRPGEVDLHIGWDIGAEGVARGLTQRLGADLLVQNYSRLVIDCNRPIGAQTSIPEVSDGIPIPANTGLSAADRKKREEEIFSPYAKAAVALSQQVGLRALFSIHSYTPVLSGVARPWDIGFLYRTAESGGSRLAGLCEKLWPELRVGRNEPYQIETASDWFIPVCAEPSGLPHCLIEIRNDHITSVAGQALWADRLTTLITSFLEASE